MTPNDRILAGALIAGLAACSADPSMETDATSAQTAASVDTDATADGTRGDAGTRSTSGEGTSAADGESMGASAGTTATSVATSSTSGVGTSASTTGEETDMTPGEPVIVAVGYGGMRVRSLDGGLTWTDYVQIEAGGGDDENLLRGVAFGEGRFVAVGERIFSSPDGADWTEHENPTPQWYGAVQYGNGQFLAVGGGGYCVRSPDGVQWERCTDATPGGFVHVRSTLFHDGIFYTADQNGVLRASPDGDVWTEIDSGFGSPWAAVEDGEVVQRNERAPAQLPDARLRGGPNRIERADPGSDDFTSVFAIPDGNNVFQAYRFAFAQGEL